MSIAKQALVPRVFRVAHRYVDRGNPHLAGDEFSAWLAIEGKTIAMLGGIRSRSYARWLDAPLPAYVVLITARVAGDHANPWDDVIDERAGVIRYWGDAKHADRMKMYDAFQGNRCMKAIYDELLVGDRTLLPPILHFSRPSTGQVIFNGLCALENMELTWFEDQGRPIRNYRFSLSILDEESIDVSWLHSRVMSDGKPGIDRAPKVWADYVRGRTRRRQLWRAHLRSVDEQLPERGSDDERVLGQLRSVPAKQFEQVIVALFREIKAVEHTITHTRYVNDAGFDFFGTFTMPLPVGYEIPFRGEVKRWKQGVGVGEVSRLVARLRRGEYGVFVTTSYYTRQAQEEVFEDAYPVKLFAGVDLVRFLRELKVVAGDRIKADWLSAVSELGA